VETDVPGVRHAVIIAAGNGMRFGEMTITRPKPILDVLGVPLIERSIRTAHVAGIDRFTVITGSHGWMIEQYLSPERFPGIEIKCIMNEDWQRQNGLSVLKAKGEVPERFVLLMADHLFEPKIISKLLAKSLPNDHCRLAVDHRPDSTVDLEDATKVKVAGGRILDVGKGLTEYDGVDTGIFLCTPSLFDALETAVASGHESLSNGIGELALLGRMEAVDVTGSFWQDVDNERDMVCGRRRLLQQLMKERDRISLFLTQYLAKTAITPNQITLFNFGLGLLGSCCMLAGTYWGFLLGATLFLLSSILDGCDGELARLKFLRSRLGGWLDITTDNITHLALFFCMTAGLVRSGLSHPYILLGMLLVTGALFSFAMTIFVQWRAGRKDGPIFSESSLWDLHDDSNDKDLSVWLDRVANRDFAYLILLLVIAGRGHWFLWIAGIGAPIFAVLLFRALFRRGPELGRATSRQSAQQI
jgi:choline kinase/phosphatidylglycerophosphate synthase